MIKGKKYSLCLVFIVGFISAGCDATLNDNDMKVETVCTDPRSEICTREYVPVCGVKADGTMKTYGNKCEACAFIEVIGYYSDECSK